MGTAKGVSRVGGLAVAFGLGVAVASTPGVALAEPGDAGPSTDSSSSSTSSSDPSADSTSPADSSSGTDSDSSGTVSSTGGPVSSESTVSVEGSPPVVVGSSGGAHTSGTAGAIDEPVESVPGDEASIGAEEASSASTPAEALEEEPPVMSGDDPHTAQAPVAEVAEVPDAESAAARRDGTASALSSRSVAGPDRSARAPLSAVDVSVQTTDGIDTALVLTEADVEVQGADDSGSAAGSPAASAIPREQSIAVAPQPVTAPVSAVTGVMSGLLGLVGFSPALTDAPVTPVAPVGLWVLLAWVRREIAHTFFNQSPTIGYDPAENSQSMHVVTGDLNAVDADGDPLAFTVTAGPQHGTVVINPDGTFAYTPSAELAQSGGADEFTVKVSDAGWHLHGLFGLFQPDQGHSATATVAVTVAANQPPHVSDQPFTIEHIDQVTGVITGSVHVTDPDGDTLAYALSTDPVYGAVTVDPKTGQWTYTPTQAARLLAALHTDTQPATITGVTAAEILPFDLPGPVPFDFFNIGVVEVESPGFGIPIPITININWGDIVPADYDTIDTIDGEFGDFPLGVAVSPDGTAYVGSHSFFGVGVFRTVSVIDTATNTVTSTFDVGDVGDDIYAVAVSPDGTTLYVLSYGDADEPGTVSVIDTVTNTVTDTIDVGGSPTDVVVSADGATAYVTNDGAGTVSVIDTDTNTVTGSIDVGSVPFDMAVSPDGIHAYVTNFGDDTVSVIDTATNTVVGAPIPVGNLPSHAVVSPDGSLVYVTNFGDDTVSVIDTATNTVVGAPISVGDQPGWVAVSPDGSLVYVAERFDLSVIDAVSKTVIARIPFEHDDPGDLLSIVAVNPDGTYIYVGRSTGSLGGGIVSVIEFLPL